MKLKNCVTALIALSGAGTLLVGPSNPAMAQSAVTATGNGTFYVELKDATLFDAIQMILKAAGNPVPYIVDESAKAVNIGSTTLPNTKWDNAILNLARVNNFLIRPNPDGTKVVEPRTPPPMEMGMPGDPGMYPGGMPGIPGMPRDPGALPSNPFGAGAPVPGAPGGFPAVRRFGAPQTAPALNSGTGTGEEASYQLLPVRHVYVGGIAKLFGDADVISSIDFLVPDDALNGGMGGGMMGGMGGGMGGFGGGMGGFGGGMGGFGGGMGGFGGGIGGGMGGFGGGMGGMGGGFGGGFGGGGMGGIGGIGGF